MLSGLVHAQALKAFPNYKLGKTVCSKVEVYRLADVWRTTNVAWNGIFGKNKPIGVQDHNIVCIHSHSRCQGSENVLFVLSWKLFCLNLRTLHRKCSSTEKTRKDKTNIYLNTEKWPLRGEFVPTFWVAREVQCKKRPQKWTPEWILRRPMSCQLFLKSNSSKYRTFLNNFYGTWRYRYTFGCMRL